MGLIAYGLLPQQLFSIRESSAIPCNLSPFESQWIAISKKKKTMSSSFKSSKVENNQSIMKGVEKLFTTSIKK